MIDQERFRFLLKTAMGDRTQQAFAEEAGLSKFTLSRFVTQGLPAQPRLGTLRGIAEASEGRVSYAELLHAAGFHREAEKVKEGGAAEEKPPYLPVPASVMEEAVALAKGAREFIRRAPLAKSLEEWAGMFEALYAGSGCKVRAGEARDYRHGEGAGYFSGAERYAPVTAEWTDGKGYLAYRMVFALFFCETRGTAYAGPSVIALDAAFDLLALSQLEMDETADILQVAAMTEDAKMTDYPVCLTARKTKTIM